MTNREARAQPAPQAEPAAIAFIREHWPDCVALEKPTSENVTAALVAMVRIGLEQNAALESRLASMEQRQRELAEKWRARAAECARLAVSACSASYDGEEKACEQHADELEATMNP